MKCILCLLSIVFAPHLILYFLSKNRQQIEEDIIVMNNKWGVSFNYSLGLVYHLIKNKYYRNIFYNRVGRKSIFCSWYLPKARDFFPCDNIGGGVYPAHPYATILNAKYIGKNFSFRQCTTIGNKKDGDKDGCPTIGDNVSLGANVCIIGNIRIGNNVIIGAGSVVVKNIPDNVIVAGNPAHIIKEINVI